MLSIIVGQIDWLMSCVMNLYIWEFDEIFTMAWFNEGHKFSLGSLRDWEDKHVEIKYTTTHKGHSKTTKERVSRKKKQKWKRKQRIERHWEIKLW